MEKKQKKFFCLIGKILAVSCLAVISLLAVNIVYAQYGGGRSGGFVFDTTAPEISNIKVSASANTATITWLTDKVSISWVVYGTTTDYGLEVKTTSYVTSHSVALSGLSPETTYHFSVKSKDTSGNIGSYIDKTFTTLAEGEEEEVVVLEKEKEEPILDKPIEEMTTEEIKTAIKTVRERLIDLIRQLISLLQEQLAQMLGN